MCVCMCLYTHYIKGLVFSLLRPHLLLKRAQGRLGAMWYLLYKPHLVNRRPHHRQNLGRTWDRPGR